MKIVSILIAGIILTCLHVPVHAQSNGVGIGTNAPNSHAVLDVVQTSGNKGILIPRVTGLISGLQPADEGLLVYHMGTHSFQYFNGTSWAYVGMPPGSIVMWSGTTAPAGWALCDGSPGTPDLRGKFVVGYQNGAPTAPAAAGDQQINYGLVGNTGGQVGVALTEAQLAPHMHGSFVSTEGHSHNYTRHASKQVGENAGGGEPAADPGNFTAPLATSTNSHTHTVIISPAGSGATHENRPPYYVLAYIIKL